MADNKHICQELMSKIIARTGLNHALLMAPHTTALIKNRQWFLKHVQISRTYLQASPGGFYFYLSQTQSCWVKISPLQTCQNV